jgi:hypothetical protein
VSVENKPYVVSADLSGIIRKWAGHSNTPPKEFIRDLTSSLKSKLEDVFPENPVEVVEEEELKSGMNELVRAFGYPTVSLDRAYIDEETPNLIGYLDATRAVDEDFATLGIIPREGCPPIETQIENLAQKYQGEIALVDDVIFSGADLVKVGGIFEMFEKKGLPIKVVIAGVGVGEGVKKVRDYGIRAIGVREYEEVLDEICKRDFFAGVPMSGRLVKDKEDQHWSAPYFKPFGDPEKWASIPKSRVADFSKFCLEQSIVLWSKIEQISQKGIATDHLPRKIKGLKSGVPVVVALKDHLDKQTYLI